METKRREVALDGPRTWIRYSFPAGSEPTSGVKTSGGAIVRATEETLSSAHKWPQATNALTDVGGDFATKKVKSLWNSDRGIYSCYGRNVGYSYVGGEYAVAPSVAISEALALVDFSSEFSLKQKGTTAIARCLPTNPVVDGATFLGELKSGLPKLVGKELFKTKFKDYKKVGSEYLNVEFGWKPIISDLEKFAKGAIATEKTLTQLARDSGKPIRRKYTFPDEVSCSTQTFNSRQSSPVSAGPMWAYFYKNPTGSTLTVDREVVTKTWFSGCFTYHLNLGVTLEDKIARQAAEARKLYGLELTPEVVWNLAPWSWIVDWEGTTGDVLHNVSRFSQDGLVMRYGYIMQEKTAKVTYTLATGGRLTGSPGSSLTTIITSQSKIRNRATPFGFGFDMSALTGRQSAILGALGISRGPRHR